LMDNCPYCGKLTDMKKYRCGHCRWPLNRKVAK
jgi:hypothetical protein